MKQPYRHLHVVSFDVPYPPDYGGVIDVYYKLKALHEQGIHITLHTFLYGRQPAPELNNICLNCYYYPRNISKSQLFNKLPYIVISRASSPLCERLAEDNSPILFEGLHTAFFLDDERLQERIKIVRTHNIEHDYYRNLAKVESNIFKRYYFYNEAEKLSGFESVLSRAEYVAAISINDTDYFGMKYGNAFYLPAFHSNETVACKPGSGAYAFYHGNLGIGENNEAAMFLLKRVFNDLQIKLVIAGNRPSEELKEAVSANPHASLIANPSTPQIRQLMSEAHVNVLPTFQPTGIKLKLLNALFNGRFCITNGMMVDQTGVESLCIRADQPEEIKQAILSVFDRSFTQSDMEERKQVLEEKFSNQKNIRLLTEKLFPAP